MAKYFLDTSAVAKLYRSELGSAFVDRIFSEPASQHLISRLTIVEMESVLALKVRTGEIDQQAVLVVRRRLPCSSQPIKNAALEGFAVTNPEHAAPVVI